MANSFKFDEVQWNSKRVPFVSNRKLEYIDNALSCITGRGTVNDLILTITDMGVSNEKFDTSPPLFKSVKNVLENYEDSLKKKNIPTNERRIRKPSWSIRGFREVGNVNDFVGFGEYENYPFCVYAINAIFGKVLESNHGHSGYINKTELAELCRVWWLDNGGVDILGDFNPSNIDFQYLERIYKIQFTYDDQIKKNKILLDNVKVGSNKEEANFNKGKIIAQQPLACLYLRLSGEDWELKRCFGTVKFGIYSRGLKARFKSVTKENFNPKIIQILTFPYPVDADILNKLTEHHNRVISCSKAQSDKKPIEKLENILKYTLFQSGLKPVGKSSEYFDIAHFSRIDLEIRKLILEYKLVGVSFEDIYKPTQLKWLKIKTQKNIESLNTDNAYGYHFNKLLFVIIRSFYSFIAQSSNFK